jgi:hypothetical protein
MRNQPVVHLGYRAYANVISVHHPHSGNSRTQQYDKSGLFSDKSGPPLSAGGYFCGGLAGAGAGRADELGADLAGSVDIYNASSGTVELVIDRTGYFSAG